MPGVRAPITTSVPFRSCVLRTCAAVASCLAFASTTLADGLEARVTPLVEATMRDGRIPGLALAVVRGGKPVLVKGYGYANLEHDVVVAHVLQQRFQRPEPKAPGNEGIKRDRRQDCVWRRPGRCDPAAAPEPGPIWYKFEDARRYLPKEPLLP